jgi:hypothetical protein
MRIPSLPECVRKLPFASRQEAMQQVVNGELHSRSICPVMQYWAGPSEPTVGVYYDRRGKYWYTSANGCEHATRALWLEEISVDAVCRMQFVRVV